MSPDKGERRPIDQVIKEEGADAILRRLSNELDTSIQLGDGTVYEDGDKHEPGDMGPEPDIVDSTEEAPR